MQKKYHFEKFRSGKFYFWFLEAVVSVVITDIEELYNVPIGEFILVATDGWFLAVYLVEPTTILAVRCVDIANGYYVT